MFADYCAARGLGVTRTLRDWDRQFRLISQAQQKQIEAELSTVNDLSVRSATRAILASLAPIVPPPEVADGPQLALWCLVHYPEACRQIATHFEFPAGEAWLVAQSQPGLTFPENRVLLKRYREVVQLVSPIPNAHPVLELHRQDGILNLISRVPTRPRHLGVFADRRGLHYPPLALAMRLQVQYHERDGTTLLYSRFLTPELWPVFTQGLESVLGSPVQLISDAFHLQRLKDHPFVQPDAADLHSVRLRMLHLVHPAAEAGRVVKLETRANDRPEAIAELLRLHVPLALRSRMKVLYAELDGQWNTSLASRWRLRLWNDRATLLQTHLGPRLRQALGHWGLWHAV